MVGSPGPGGRSLGRSGGGRYVHSPQELPLLGRESVDRTSGRSQNQAVRERVVSERVDEPLPGWARQHIQEAPAVLVRLRPSTHKVRRQQHCHQPLTRDVSEASHPGHVHAALVCADGPRCVEGADWAQARGQEPQHTAVRLHHHNGIKVGLEASVRKAVGDARLRARNAPAACDGVGVLEIILQAKGSLGLALDGSHAGFNAERDELRPFHGRVTVYVDHVEDLYELLDQSERVSLVSVGVDVAQKGRHEFI